MKAIVKTLIACTALTFTTLSTAAEDIERACKTLVMDYAVYRDSGDAERYANLFTKAGTLTLLGQTYYGRAAILARMKAAPAETSMHLMSTVRVYPESATRARGVSYAEVYIEPDGELPKATEGFMAIGRYLDKFEKTRDGWKIAERRLEVVLTRAASETASR